MDFHLVAFDNKTCLEQAIFRTLDDGKIHFIAVIGSRGVNQIISREQAHLEFRTLVDDGWVLPFQTPPIAWKRIMRAIKNG